VVNAAYSDWRCAWCRIRKLRVERRHHEEDQGRRRPKKNLKRKTRKKEMKRIMKRNGKKIEKVEKMSEVDVR